MEAKRVLAISKGNIEAIVRLSGYITFRFIEKY